MANCQVKPLGAPPLALVCGLATVLRRLTWLMRHSAVPPPLLVVDMYSTKVAARSNQLGPARCLYKSSSLGSSVRPTLWGWVGLLPPRLRGLWWFKVFEFIRNSTSFSL